MKLRKVPELSPNRQVRLVRTEQLWLYVSKFLRKQEYQDACKLHDRDSENRKSTMGFPVSCV